MAELVLGAFLPLLIEKLADQYLLEEWRKTLKIHRDVLEDAQEKQLTNREVRRWLDDLHDLLYDVDDFVDELAYEAQARRRIKSSNRSRARAMMMLMKPGVEEIVEMLMKPGVEAAEVPVITILGMGGMGKTTLAQDVYHDENVVKCFDLKAWVCVSDVFDVAGITRTILGSRFSDDKRDLDMLQEELKEMLLGKKFLLVLDDIWNENYGEWDVLRRPFRYGAAGSRILATTRNKRVASIMTRSNEPYVLSVLGHDDGLSLLALHALGREDFHGHWDLKESSEKIVEKCSHLPLAIKTIAGLLLHIPQERRQWEDVLNNKKWAEGSYDILPAIRLSYDHLPYHLKRCFAYCSIIPKDYIFNKNELVLLWMAEDLLQQQVGNNRQMEDFGHDCFQELVSRSFFQLTGKKESKFIMHDLINDMTLLFMLLEKGALEWTMNGTNIGSIRFLTGLDTSPSLAKISRYLKNSMFSIQLIDHVHFYHYHLASFVCMNMKRLIYQTQFWLSHCPD